MSLAKYVKDPTEQKRYQIDYTNWLDTGEGVTSVVFSVLNQSGSSPLVINSIQVLPTGLGVQYYVSGGLDGTTYRVLATLTTNTGPQVREDELIYVVRSNQ